MRPLLLFLSLLAMPALADEPVLRPSARLVFKKPELLQPGTCVVYKEGGSGWIMTKPAFYLMGKVVSAEIRGRRLQTCPTVPGKTMTQYTREEFNRHTRAFPCLQEGETERDMQIGMVRLTVTDWETPHAKKMESAGRLYRGAFVDKLLTKGMELEVEADLLEACPQ